MKADQKPPIQKSNKAEGRSGSQPIEKPLPDEPQPKSLQRAGAEEGSMLQSARLRDGGIIEMGDVVLTNWHPKCAGVEFQVFEIRKYPWCESGTLVNVHVKGHPDRILKSSDGLGFDVNWFKKNKC